MHCSVFNAAAKQSNHLPFPHKSTLTQFPNGPFYHRPRPRPRPLPMSTALSPPPLTSSFSHSITSIGLGYSIAIALGFLVLFSSVILASYICCRSAAARRRTIDQRQDSYRSNEHSIYLPRVLFVAEGDDDNDAESSRNVVLGLDQSVINSYPKFVFSKKKGNGGDEGICSICLCEYRESEMLRMLPDCKHYFHIMCVDSWLKLNASCPVCRNSPLPTPLSTPLQEVVPLSQYSDGRRR